MKILNYGSLNLDYVYEVDHFVKGGETLSSNSRHTYCGGKGLNQSIALAKAGAQVWHAGAIGKADGEILKNTLEDSGVSTEFVKYIDAPTGHAIIQKNKVGDNCILLYGGANLEITEDDIEKTLEGFGAGDYLILQNEISMISKIIEIAVKKAMIIVLNPSPMNEKIFTYPLDKIDYFVLNEVEAAQLCNKEGDGELLLNTLRYRFIKAKILLTLGEQGSMYIDSSGIIKQKIYPVKVIDTTAAGDTFTGFFISCIATGCDVKYAMDIAAKASSIACSSMGAAPSIPTLKQVNEFCF